MTGLSLDWFWPVHAALAGIALGCGHWAMFRYFTKNLLKHQESAKVTRKLVVIAFLRVSMTVILGAMAVALLGLPAKQFSLGFLAGFCFSWFLGLKRN